MSNVCAQFVDGPTKYFATNAASDSMVVMVTPEDLKGNLSFSLEIHIPKGLIYVCIF
jgi:hypothetical protein